MDLSRDAIVEGLVRILGAANVVTDARVLQQRSIDNFRKLENIFGVYTLPPPAAVAMVGVGLAVARVELVDGQTLRAVNAFKGTSYPEAPGILMSDTTRSYFERPIDASASVPSQATSTRQPQETSTSWIVWRMSSSSSPTRMRLPRRTGS